MAADGETAGVEAGPQDVVLTDVGAFVGEHTAQPLVAHPVKKTGGQVDARPAWQQPNAVGFRVGMFMQGDRGGHEGRAAAIRVRHACEGFSVDGLTARKRAVSGELA